MINSQVNLLTTLNKSFLALEEIAKISLKVDKKKSPSLNSYTETRLVSSDESGDWTFLFKGKWVRPNVLHCLHNGGGVGGFIIPCLIVTLRKHLLSSIHLKNCL